MADIDRVLDVKGLTKSFGDRVAVDDVSFAIDAGETYGLLGPNGAGKTTLISMVAGTMTSDRGGVVVAGLPMDTRALDAKQAIGLVPQELAVYPDLSGRENLRFFGRLYGLGRAELGRRVDEVLDIIELIDRADDRADEYSGGMKRRLNIGIGLLHRPRLLILDEPTVGVDPQSRNAILTSVERLGAEGMAVLYTTHYMEEAERLCDRVGIIDLGRIIAEGTRRELVASIGVADRVHLEASGALESAAAHTAELSAVETAVASDGSIDLIVNGASDLLPDIIQSAAAAGAAVTHVDVAEPDLETVFLQLTGKALRE